MTDDNHQLAGYYDQKDPAYYQGARRDFVDRLADNPNGRILEIGCSAGATGALALDAGKCSEYIGIELSPEIAEMAKLKLTEVYCDDIEKMDLDFAEQSFDACIMSEVLEHLVDPWMVLRRIHGLLRPGAQFLASSPNVSHWHIVRQLLRGRFDLTDIGPMDRTHLRWFTPATFGEMFETCGYDVEQVWPIKPLKKRHKLIGTLLGGRNHLFVRQMCVSAHRSPHTSHA